MDELNWSRRLFTKMGWRTIDVTDQAVEETAGRILQLVGKS
jgi:regulator of PEP synthase PpsR (kinase-PPPase family)